MKVKSFFKIFNEPYEGFDDKINEFIKDKNVVDVKFQKNDDNAYVLVLYEDKEE